MEIVATNANSLFKEVIRFMFEERETIDCPEHSVAKELINATLILTDPTLNLMNAKDGRNMSMRYAVGEFLWYMSNSPFTADIDKFSKFWKTIENDDHTVNSNYGWCIRDKYNCDQWENCKYILRNNPASRKAIIHIKECIDYQLAIPKDVNCTLTLQFLIRNNKLHMITNMRSNDVWLGLPYDIFCFTCMQILMAMELHVDIGNYYHNAGSLHLYKKNFEKAQEIYNRIKGGTNAV